MRARLQHWRRNCASCSTKLPTRRIASRRTLHMPWKRTLRPPPAPAPVPAASPVADARVHASGAGGRAPLSTPAGSSLVLALLACRQWEPQLRPQPSSMSSFWNSASCRAHQIMRYVLHAFLDGCRRIYSRVHIFVHPLHLLSTSNTYRFFYPHRPAHCPAPVLPSHPSKPLCPEFGTDSTNLRPKIGESVPIRQYLIDSVPIRLTIGESGYTTKSPEWKIPQLQIILLIFKITR